MAVKTRSVMLNLQSKLEALGRFASVSIGEPSEPPNSPHAAVILSRFENAGTTLAKTIERRILVVRVYIKAFNDPRGDNEFLMDDIATEFMESVWGDFDLGGNVRNPEPLGVTVNFGYQTIANTVYRIADISLPLIVDDSATFVQ